MSKLDQVRRAKDGVHRDCGVTSNNCDFAVRACVCRTGHYRDGEPRDPVLRNPTCFATIYNSDGVAADLRQTTNPRSQINSGCLISAFIQCARFRTSGGRAPVSTCGPLVTLTVARLVVRDNQFHITGRRDTG